MELGDSYKWGHSVKSRTFQGRRDMWVSLKDGRKREVQAKERERDACRLPALLHPRAEVLLAKKRTEHPKTSAAPTPLLLGKITP